MAKNITFCGVCCAISVVLLMLTNVLTFNTAFLICAATVVFPLIKIKCGSGFSFAALTAAGLLSFMFLPDKFLWAAFSLIALYSLVKGYIEKIEKLWLEILVKAIIYVAVATAVLNIFPQQIFLVSLSVGGVIFAIYDFALSIFITYIMKKLRF